MLRVSINPQLFTWARERDGVEQEILTAKPGLKNLPEWERGNKQPTLKQLEKFAHAVHVPFGYMFLREPPDESILIPDFRTVSNSTPTKMSTALRDTIYTMQRRQEWLRDYLVDLGGDGLDFVASASLSDNPEDVASAMRSKLGLDSGWGANVSSWQSAVSEFHQMIESLGVITVINGVVGNNTNRKLDVREFRGFALIDAYAPLIFVNGADAKSAQMFTQAHELAHIWLGKSGISGFEEMIPEGTEVEVWCNRAAAELLIPASEFHDHWPGVRDSQRRFEELARIFKVSPIVAARRARDLELITYRTFSNFYSQTIKDHRSNQRSGSGGDFFSTQNFRVGRKFATYVIRAALQGQLSFKDAYELTGLHGGTFQKYANRLDFSLPR